MTFAQLAWRVDVVFWPSVPVSTCESARRCVVTLAKVESGNSEPPLAESRSFVS